MTWLAKAPGGRGVLWLAVTHARTHARTHAHSNPKIIHTKVAQAPAEITEPCPISGLPLFKKAGRGKKKEERKNREGEEEEGEKMDVKGSQMGQARSKAKDQDVIQMFRGESLEKSKFSHSV